MLATVAAPWLLLATILVPPGSQTVWLDGTVGRQGWEQTARSPAEGWLLAELSSAGTVDLDLAVSDPAAGWRRSAASHQAREWLLVRVDAGAALRVRVGGPDAEGAVFRLGLTRVAALERPFADRSPVLDPGAGPRVRILQVDAPADDELLRIAISGPDPGVPPAIGLGAFGLGGQPVALIADGALLTLPTNGPTLVVLAAPPDAGPLRVRARVAPRATRPEDGLDGFLERLGRTAAQRAALAALRTNPDFARIRGYLEAYPGGLPIRLHAVPGLRAQGVERFGTYANRVLAINPTLAAHRTNVQELVDTLVHELIHAILSLPRAPGFPFAADVLDSAHDPRLASLGNTPLRRSLVAAKLTDYLDAEYGVSASNPSEDYCDVNAAAQRLIVKVVRDTLARTRLGRETLVFENVRTRERFRLGEGSAKK